MAWNEIQSVPRHIRSLSEHLVQLDYMLHGTQNEVHFAENVDMVDPEFDFIKDRSSSSREPYWDDVYPHQLLGHAPYDGLLVSRAIVGGHVKTGKYNESQAMRFRREGARKFLRFSEQDYPNTVMWGDCGAFAYVNEEVPPYTVDEIVEFYADGQFTHGCSVDHIIFEFQDTEFDFSFDDSEVRRRQEITLSNAAEFITKSRDRIGVTLLQLVSSMVGHRRQWPRQQLNWSKWDMITLQ